MSAIPGPLHYQDVSRQWLALAERRVAYYTELYRSGDWQRYYTNESFAARINDVIRAVTIWKNLAGQSQEQAQEQASNKSDPHPAA